MQYKSPKSNQFTQKLYEPKRIANTQAKKFLLKSLPDYLDPLEQFLNSEAERYNTLIGAVEQLFLSTKTDPQLSTTLNLNRVPHSLQYHFLHPHPTFTSFLSQLLHNIDHLRPLLLERPKAVNLSCLQNPQGLLQAVVL